MLYGNTYGRRRRERPEIGARVIGIAGLRTMNNNNNILYENYTNRAENR